jgi:hypothetical protein
MNFDLILQNVFAGFACFASGGVLGYVVAKLGGISGVISDVATLKSDVSNLKIQSPITVTPIVKTSTPTHSTSAGSTSAPVATVLSTTTLA